MSNNLAITDDINIKEYIDKIILQSNDTIFKKINELIHIDNLDYAKLLAFELINKDKNYKDAYLVLSDIYYEEEDFDSVIKILDEGLSILNDDTDLIKNKIEALINTYEYDSAIDIINYLISKNIITSDLYGQYGNIYSHQGDYNKSIEYYKKAIELDSNDICSLINMSISYTSLYMYDEALDILNKAYSLDSSKFIKSKQDKIKSLKELSYFDSGNLIPIKTVPDKFHLLIPDNFKAYVDDCSLRFESADDKTHIILSVANIDNRDDISILFNDFKSHSGELYSIVSPFSINVREEYDDIFASMIFTSKVINAYLFNAMAIVKKDNDSIMLTISSSVAISSKLITFTNNILNSLYFK